MTETDNIDDCEWVPDGVHMILLGEGKDWRQQGGGKGCLQLTATGKLIPIEASEETQDKLFHHFQNSKWDGWCDNGIDAEASIVIEILFSDLGFIVDFEKIGESCEAWIYGFYQSKPAILTWTNGD